MSKNKAANGIYLNAFFSRGIFVREQLVRLIVACVFACYALSAFCVAMNAFLTDTEMAAFRSCYHHGITKVEIVAIETHFFEWKHGTVSYQIDLSEKQIRALTEYAGESLKIIDGKSHTYAEISLSGDRKKDRKFIRDMRYTEKNIVKRIGFEIKSDFAPHITFAALHKGVILNNWESILLFVSVAVAAVVASVLFLRRRQMLTGAFKNDDVNSIPSKKTFLLQGAFLIGVLFVASVLFAYMGISIMNARGSYTPFVVPEPISVIATLALGAVLVLPYAVPKNVCMNH
ncbi:MAG: hypothetical protein J1F39_03445 [Clostridiales bacterium]|nr:hypothetical protein [Clostridiales bacterium]